jgi:hypothetical protein
MFQNVELPDPFTVPRQNPLLVTVKNQTCDNEIETIPTPSMLPLAASVGGGGCPSKRLYTVAQAPRSALHRSASII